MIDILLVIATVIFVFACGATGAMLHLQRCRKLLAIDDSRGVKMQNLRQISLFVGSISGLAIGGLLAYYLALNQSVTIVAWLGRFSYILIISASSYHVLHLLHVWLHIKREEDGGDLGKGDLGRQRIESLRTVRQSHRHYTDLRTRDEELLDDLVGFLSEPLLNIRRDLTRLPLYGYLGTVCGILLMAQELGEIDEASQTFSVLSSMADGLVLAFKTTLVALIVYIPLRKVVDLLIARLALLEKVWRNQRERGLDEK